MAGSCNASELNVVEAFDILELNIIDESSAMLLSMSEEWGLITCKWLRRWAVSDVYGGGDATLSSSSAMDCREKLDSVAIEDVTSICENRPENVLALILLLKLLLIADVACDDALLILGVRTAFDRGLVCRRRLRGCNMVFRWVGGGEGCGGTASTAAVVADCGPSSAVESLREWVEGDGGSFLLRSKRETADRASFLLRNFFLLPVLLSISFRCRDDCCLLGWLPISKYMCYAWATMRDYVY